MIHVLSGRLRYHLDGLDGRELVLDPGIWHRVARDGSTTSQPMDRCDSSSNFIASKGPEAAHDRRCRISGKTVASCGVPHNLHQDRRSGRPDTLCAWATAAGNARLAIKGLPRSWTAIHRPNRRQDTDPSAKGEKAFLGARTPSTAADSATGRSPRSCSARRSLSAATADFDSSSGRLHVLLAYSPPSESSTAATRSGCETADPYVLAAQGSRCSSRARWRRLGRPLISRGRRGRRS